MEEEFKNSRYPLPDNIRKGRNIAIVLGFLEIVCCVLAFGFYIRRRSRNVLAIIIYCLLCTAGGFYAKLKLTYCGLLAHAMFSIPVIAGFYIYIMIDNFLKEEKTNENSGALSETVILIVTTLPFLSLFVMGIYSLNLCI